MPSLVLLSRHTPVDSSSHPAQQPPHRTAAAATPVLLVLALVLAATVAAAGVHFTLASLFLIVKMRASSARKIQRADRLLRVGYYDLERTLGKGNFAVVRLGIHRLTKTQVQCSRSRSARKFIISDPDPPFFIQSFGISFLKCTVLEK